PDLLAGQVAVVTGGSSGLGRETALRFGQAGVAGVVVADVRHDPREGGAPTTELLAEQGVRSTFVACDVRSASGCAAAVEAAEDLGGVTIMVPAAGVLRQENVL